MILKTKKYKLEPSLYIKTAMMEILRKQWWFIVGPVAIACLAFIWPSWWFISIAILIVVLYLLFWAVQFAGVTQLEQNKMLFQKMSYEIDGRQILMKINEREGMPVKWEMIKTAIENQQDLIVEGCYIPFDWRKDLTPEYLDKTQYYCLVMSENYIRKHFADIKRYANVIEKRLDDGLWSVPG